MRSHVSRTGLHVVTAFGIIDAIAIAHIQTLWAQYCQTAYWTNRGKVCGSSRVCNQSISPSTIIPGQHQFALLAARTKVDSSALKRAASSQNGAWPTPS
jgi:hypothetical protein